METTANQPSKTKKDLLSLIQEEAIKQQRKSQAPRVPDVTVSVIFKGEDAELFVRGYHFYQLVCEANKTEPSFADYLRLCHEGEAINRFKAKKVSLKEALAAFPMKAEKGKKRQVVGESLT